MTLTIRPGSPVFSPLYNGMAPAMRRFAHPDREPYRRHALLTSVKSGLVLAALSLAVFAFVAAAAPACAQNSVPASTKMVKADSLTVYSQMDPTSDVVQKLKKGDHVVLGFELANDTGQWCSVTLPGHMASLGYVLCSGLDLASLDSTVRKSTAAGASSDFSLVAAPSDASGASTPFHPRRDVRLAPPSERAPANYAQIASQVVGDDGIRSSRLDELDNAARNGSPAATTWAAVAHLAAGRYLLNHNDAAHAVSQFRAAVDLTDRLPEIQFPSLLDLAYAHLERSEFQAAIDPLLRAQQLMPASVSVARYAGWAYYELSQPDKAVTEWERAQQLSPDPSIAGLLAQAQRDRTTERAFQQGATAHFVLRYEGGAAPGLAQNVLFTLEEEYQDLQALFHYTPPQQIGVVLYTNRQFEDVTRAPSWSGGLNDGRIRVPVQGLTTVTPDLARVLKHELTHSFVGQMTQYRCPSWLQEGLAQWVEGQRTDASVAQQLIALYDQKHYIPLGRLEGGWTSMPAPVASFAYAWALASVEGMLERYEIWGVERLLKAIDDGEPTNHALKDTMQTSYQEIDAQTIAYLKKAFPN